MAGMSRNGHQSDEIRLIPTASIRSFGGNRYFAVNEKKVVEYAESIRAVGILNPLIVRPDYSKKAEYELIAGEHRLRAAMLAGLDEVPCQVKELTDVQAQREYGESNRQRETLSIMERAYMALYADESQNASKNIAIGTECRSENFSDRQKLDLKKLTMLTRNMQQLVDSRKISVKAGAKAAELPASVQDMIHISLVGSKRVLTVECVEWIKTAYENECLPFGIDMSPTRLEELLLEGQPERIKKVHIAVPRKLIRKLPAEYKTKAAQEALIEKLLDDFLGQK